MRSVVHRVRPPAAAAAICATVLLACSDRTGPAAPAPIAHAAALELSVPALELTERATFVIRNRGDSPLEWRAREDLPWVSVVPAAGRLDRGETAVEVIAASGGLSPGPHAARVTIESNGGSADLALTILVPTGSVPPPPASPPPVGGFAARVADLVGLAAVPGAALTVGGLPAVSDAAGWFVVPAAPAGVQPVTVSAPGMVTRSTFASTSAPLSSPLTLVPATYDLAAYEDVAREVWRDATVRWVAPPQIYVDARPDAYTGTPVPAGWVAATAAAARTFPAIWTDGHVLPAVEVGTTPPSEGTPGTILVRFDEELNPAGCGGRVGEARFAWNDDGVLLHGVVRLAPARLCGGSMAVLQAVVAHELGHTMGLGHATLPGRSSLMAPTVRLAEPSALDRAVARLHYGRAPGHAAPDREPAGAALLNFARASHSPAARRTFVCDAAAQR